jgi:hypothetical protein
MSPNKHMQRAGTHKVLGRGRQGVVHWSAPRARVLTGKPAGADVSRWATLCVRRRGGFKNDAITLVITFCTNERSHRIFAPSSMA